MRKFLYGSAAAIGALILSQSAWAQADITYEQDIAAVCEVTSLTRFIHEGRFGDWDRACVRVALGALFRPSMTTFVVNKTGLDNGHVAPLIRVARRERGRRSGRGFACRGSSTAARP